MRTDHDSRQLLRRYMAAGVSIDPEATMRLLEDVEELLAENQRLRDALAGKVGPDPNAEITTVIVPQR